jgi:hypothetical protein
MERGVYHAKQKALSHTVDRSKTLYPTTGAQGKHKPGAKPAPAARQPLAKNQALRLGQPLAVNEQKAAEAAFFVFRDLKLRLPADQLASS